ncbi:MAG: TatD family hydrolase [Acidimicrobiia bacterium]|nr:TatD family hydrolase [Acidimicrobiia bacterium]
MWVDTHCHLQLDDRDPAELLDRAPDVSWLVAPGVDVASSAAGEKLSLAHPGRVRWSAGLHPHDADQWSQQGDAIAEMATRAAAVGECGLDFYRNLSPRDAQLVAFHEQLELASSLGKPIIVHCRDAFADVFASLDAILGGPQVVLHCWTGGPKWSRRFLDLGVTFSFAGPVAFETGDTVRRGAAVIPPERVMVETDTPYLSPPPFRSEPNEPARVSLVGASLAEVWELPINEVARLSTARATEVFGS